jgi:hypothetical protein
MNRFNRALWTVIGALLVLAGAAGIAANRGWLPGVDTTRVLLSPNAGHNWHRLGFWAPLLAIVAGVILALLGALLIRAELRLHERPAMTDLTIAASAGTAGRTEVDTGTLARAMRRDLRAGAGISDARVRITGHPDHPSVSLHLWVDQGVGLAPVHARVERSLQRLAATMPGEPKVDDVLVTVGDKQPARVR